CRPNLLLFPSVHLLQIGQTPTCDLRLRSRFPYLSSPAWVRCDMTWIREANSEPIPGYRLIEPLGSGGFGEVWKCEAPGGLFKAIEFVYGNLNSLDVEGARAEQEMHALERVKAIRHPF